jgi:hypothetical protein
MTNHSFEAVVESEGPGAFVEVPLDVPAELGRKRAPVIVTVNGHTFRTTVAVYGGRYYLPLNRSVREASGISVGDAAVFAIESDDAPREVEVPKELADALAKDDAARSAFQALSYTHRREHAAYVSEAKKTETRVRRAQKTVEALKN